MPSLIVQDTNARMRRHRLRVFVSYAHEDARSAATFIEHLRLLWGEFRFDERDLFYDAKRLLPGYVWEEPLVQALKEADVFIILVSTKALLSGHYCMDVEVATAAQAGALIVPVVVTQCSWQGVQIPGAPEGRTFGALGALPLTDKRVVKPVKHWKKIDQAWHTVIEGLRAVFTSIGASATGNTIGSTGSTAGNATGSRPIASAGSPADFHADSHTASRAAAPTATETELLPYLCNQTHATGAFDLGLDRWQARALVVLVKGIYDDNTARFWQRLRLEHLSQFVALDPTRGQLLSLDHPFMLPVGDSKNSVDALKRAIFYELSHALTGNRYRLTNARELTAHLRGVPGAISLLAMPATGSVRALKSAIEALFAVLGDVDLDDVRRRIVVAINLEGAGNLHDRLFTEKELARFEGSFVLELDPLVMVRWNDARVWYVQRRINDRFQVDESRLAAVFHHGAALRMRAFEGRVRPLLKAR